MDINITGTDNAQAVIELAWYQWLQTNLESGVDYRLVYRDTQWRVEIFDSEKFTAFVSENSLD